MNKIAFYVDHSRTAHRPTYFEGVPILYLYGKNELSSSKFSNVRVRRVHIQRQTDATERMLMNALTPHRILVVTVDEAAMLSDKIL